tara:strand:+ start:2719 stop:3075 length:357 start_codon:yes stop_codon:yes gene_type:complete
MFLGLRGRYPRCGAGELFDVLCSVRRASSVYGLGLKAEDIGDGPTVFVMFILGSIALGLATWLEIAVTPSYWFHLVIWLSMVVVSRISFLRHLKAAWIAPQFSSRAREGGLITFDPRY